MKPKRSKEITLLNQKLYALINAFEFNREYQDLNAKKEKIEAKMKAIRDKWHISNEREIAEVKKQITHIAIQQRANSLLAHDPAIHGSKFLSWWDQVYFGTGWYRTKELIWLSDDQTHCLIKIPGQANPLSYGKYLKVRWEIRDVTQDPNNEEPAWETEGRWTWIKKIAAETKLGIKINLK